MVCRALKFFSTKPMDNYLPEQNIDSLKNAISAGADLGMKTGCLLSAIYSFIAVVIILGFFDALGSTPYAVIAASPIYMLILIPVLPLGAITGAILGWLSKILASVVPQQKFFLVGIFVCILLLVILHVVFFAIYPLGINDNEAPVDQLEPLLTYLIFIGIPSILYIAGGGWVSQRLTVES